MISHSIFYHLSPVLLNTPVFPSYSAGWAPRSTYIHLCPLHTAKGVGGGASVASGLNDLANAEVDLEPRGAGHELRRQQRRDLDEVHRQERQRVVAGEEGVPAAGHLPQGHPEAAARGPEAQPEEDLVHEPIAMDPGPRGYDLRGVRRPEVRVRERGAEVLMVLEGAHGAVDAGVALDGKQGLPTWALHEVQRQLPREAQGPPQAHVQVLDGPVVLRVLLVHEAGGGGPEQLEAGQLAAVVEGVAAVLGLGRSCSWIT